MGKWWKRSVVSSIAVVSVVTGLLAVPSQVSADTVGQYTTTTGAVIKFSTSSDRKVTVTATGLRAKVVDDVAGWCWFRVILASDPMIGSTNGSVGIKSDGTFTDTVGPLPSNGSYTAILDCTPQTDNQLEEMNADPQNPKVLFPMTDPSGVSLTVNGTPTSGVPTSPHPPGEDNLKWLWNTGNFILCMGSVALLAFPVAAAGVLSGTAAALGVAAGIARVPLIGSAFKVLISPCLKSVLNIDDPNVY